MLASLALHNYLRCTDNASSTPVGFVDSESGDGSLIHGDYGEEVSTYNNGLRNINPVRGSRLRIQCVTNLSVQCVTGLSVQCVTSLSVQFVTALSVPCVTGLSVQCAMGLFIGSHFLISSNIKRRIFVLSFMLGHFTPSCLVTSHLHAWSLHTFMLGHFTPSCLVTSQ